MFRFGAWVALLGSWTVAQAVPVRADDIKDPFAYCAAVGTTDAPDARYQGPAMPEAVIRGLRRAIGAPADAPDTAFASSFWRCMDGKLYACTVGANLPCQTKADPSRVPTAAMRVFCVAQPEADAIPAATTGRATVYAWRCRGGAPVIERQVTQIDPRGYQANIWYEIPRR
jgi:hypothetical protein